MASFQRRSSIIFMFFTSCLVSAISARLVCEDLPVDLCAFSVSSSGSRCALEKTILMNGDIEHQCQTSQVGADEFVEWVETDKCIQSCGLNRMSVGISSDALVERGFAKSLCSARCQNNCPNMVHLFTNLAAGEGVSLKQMCEEALSGTGGAIRREMGEVSFASVSSNTLNAWEKAASAGPTTSQSLVGSSLNNMAPAPAPTARLF